MRGSVERGDGCMVKIIADSTCDLTEEICERYDITILPLYVRLGEDEFLDGVNVMPDDLYTWSDAHKETPKTAAPSVGDALAVFEKALETYDGIVAFSISATMSASFNNMRLAAEELDEADIRIVDSQNLSTGIGLLVIKASELARQGFGAKEIADRINILREKVRASFVVDTLTYLHRGGRCSGLAAMLGGRLKLHPKIIVENGKMHVGKKYRGNIKTSILNYVRDMEEALKGADTSRVFITHSGCAEETVSEVKAYLRNCLEITCAF